MQASIFISHSFLDKGFVNQLASELRSKGVGTWIDDRQIKVGQKISRRIMEGIYRCDYFLIVLSKNSEKSNWVKHELESAYFEAVSQREDVILPVLLDDVALPKELKNLKYADFRKGFEAGFKELIGIFDIDEDYRNLLSRQDREKQIRKLLNFTNVHGELSSEVILLVEDESYLPIFEENLKESEENDQLLYNSIDAIKWLADYTFDHRVIKDHSSISLLINLYEKSTNIKLRKKIMGALASIGSKMCWDFLTSKLNNSNNALKAEILTGFYQMASYGDYADWNSKIMKSLHKYSTFFASDCLYFDYEKEEEDYRFWVFRCLAEARKRSSLKYIERFLEEEKWPLSTLSEAAAAHWHISKSQKYINILKRAKRKNVSSSASVTLDNIKEYTERKKKNLLIS